MKYFAYFAFVMFIGYDLQAGEPVEPEDPMDQLIAMVQANADAIAMIADRARAHIPGTTHKVVNIPPEKQIIEATSPRSFAVNHEARVSGHIYVTEQPHLQQVITRAMPVPDGYHVVRVEQPPLYTVSEYAQPDTFEMKPIAQPVTIQPVTVTAAQEGALITISEDGITAVGDPQ